MTILRYTIGPVKQIGFQILKESVRLMKEIYPEFHIIICHNQLKKKQIDFLKTLSVELYEQKHEILSCSPTVENWKLYPPRLSLNDYELVLDNDLVIKERSPSIDQFLSSNKTLVMSAVYRAYGQFAEFVPEKVYINCGIYGMPPGFDFESKIKVLCNKKGTKEWSPRFDDQGLVAACLHENAITIPMDEIKPLGENSEFYKAKGYHFISANRDNFHTGWKGYKREFYEFL